MSPRVLAIISALAAAHMVAAADALAKPKLAILGIEPVDAGDSESQEKTAALARWLTEGLRSRVSSARARYELAPNSNRELGELKLLSDCIDEGRECMAAIGRELGADRLMFGRIERRRDGYEISIRLLNVATKSFEKQKKDVISPRAATAEGMRRAATVHFSDLTGIAIDATLVIQTNVSTGTVIVEGEPRGVIASGTTTVRGLPEGLLAVSVESPGYQRWDGLAETKAGEVKRLEVTMEPEGGARPSGPRITEPPPAAGRRDVRRTYRTLAWTSAVVTAGGVTAFTVTGLKVQDFWFLSMGESYEEQKLAHIDEVQATSPGRYQSNDVCREAAGDGDADMTSICDSGRKWAKVTNGLVAVTTAMALATGYFAYKGYAGGPPATTERPPGEARRRNREPPRLVVTPEIYPQGAGLGAIIQF